MTPPSTLPRALQEAESFATVFVMAQLLSRLGDDVLAPLELTTKQWLLLAVVARRFAGSEPTLSEVAPVYGSSRQNVKQIAQQLERHGWLRLVGDPADGRAVRLRLTAKLKLFAAPAHKARERRFFERIFRDMGSDDVADLHRLLGQWLRSLTTPDAGDP